MIGKTNALAGMKQKQEMVNISLSSNQASHDDLVGAVITLSYGEYTEEIVWSGNEVTRAVPAYVEYTVSFGDVENHKTPAAVTNTSVEGNVRSITGTYQTEILTVNVTSDIDLPSSYTVTVSGIGSQTTASKVYKVPFDTSYTVSATAADGYSTPASQSFTANSASRSVTMEYLEFSIPTGIFIQSTDGALYTESEWDGSKTPNGVAVVTDNCQFVMALADAYSSYCQWGGYGTEVSGVVAATSESTATTDYAGEANTTTIINALNGTNDGYVDGAPAAEYCRAYTFPNGATGYMGAAGEWQAALDNKTAITSALSKCGGTAMSSYYWTSTQSSSYASWCMAWLNGYLSFASKVDSGYVRAFAAI